MAQFINPFPGLLEDGKLDENAVIQSLRQALAAEEEAIHLYETMAKHIDNGLVVEVLHDIAGEEQVHVGELQELIEKLDKNEVDKIEKGRKEVQDKEGSGKADTEDKKDEKDKKDDSDKADKKEDKTSFKIDKNALKQKLSNIKTSK